MTIITLHTIDKNPATNDVLADVIKSMRTMGAPVIRCFYAAEGVCMAVEGCHRIEAARQLGLTPVLDVLDIDSDDEIPADIAEEMGRLNYTMRRMRDGNQN